ncbi:MAG: hypothetical protein AAF289_18740 [Cyanobacteria bacterium P01_A01_bin.135]
MPPSDLLIEIAFCPQMQRCLADPRPHPCRAVVAAQGSASLAEHRLPQPWSGLLHSAPILFVSPNPSLRLPVAYPTGNWQPGAIAHYFNHRFDGDWIAEGNKARLTDGTYSRSIRFWVEIRQRAGELLQRQAVPGVDYALTHVVHCEAVGGIGVTDAQDYCAQQYLNRTIAASGAWVVVVLGRQARRVVQQHYGFNGETVAGPVEVGAVERWFAFLPHTNARGYRSFERCVMAEELAVLRRVVGDRRR